MIRISFLIYLIWKEEEQVLNSQECPARTKPQFGHLWFLPIVELSGSERVLLWIIKGGASIIVRSDDLNYLFKLPKVVFVCGHVTINHWSQSLDHADFLCLHVTIT